MPSLRTLQSRQLRFSPPAKVGKYKTQSTDAAMPQAVAVASEDEIVDFAKCDIVYPLDDATRRAFRTKEGKIPTAHQWAVYDFVRKIPVGKVSTYKDIWLALGQGSPRTVGGALRNNPFAPFIPCHRVIASNRYVGGFFGEWGENAGSGTQYHRKIDMLAKEGVGFNEKGYLLTGDVIWKG